MLRRQLLETYLDDHWAGAGAGTALADRVAHNNGASAWHDRLARLAHDVAEDEVTLSKVREHFGFHGGRAKRLFAQVGERAARAKPNGRLLTYSPLSRVLEAEALASGITAKRQLWVSLNEAGGFLREPAPFDFGSLVERADAQLELVCAFHLDAAREAFGDPVLVRPG